MGIDVKENDRLVFRTGKSSAVKDILNGSGKRSSADEIVEVKISLIDHLSAFEHPFEKSVNTGIKELARSMESQGQLVPVILRPKEGGRYELLAGHRRTAAMKLLERTYIKAIIKECDIEAAKIIVTDTNLEQRDEILPSEKAKAYKLRLEAIKQTAGRPKINFGHSVQNFEKYNSYEVMAGENNENARQIQRYIRLNELIEPLLNRVDEKNIGFIAAVEISYLKEPEQQRLEKLLVNDESIVLTKETAKELKEASREMELTVPIIEAIINPPKEDKIKEFKPPKPAYKTAFLNVQKHLKKLDGELAEKVALADAKELEKRIKETVEEYLASL